MNTDFRQNLNSRLELAQQLSPKQYQALEILSTPTLELEPVINRILEQNPVLELENIPGEFLAGDILTADSGREMSPDTDGDPLNRDDGFAELAELASGWQDLAPDGTVAFAERDRDNAGEYALSVAGAKEDDMESPAMQLRFADAPPEIVKLAELLLEYVDQNGFLTINLADFALVNSIDMSAAGAALDLLQSLEPAGIGARSYQEALLLQLRRAMPEEAAGNTGRILEEFFDDMLHNRLPVIARALKVSVTEVENMVGIIKSFSPVPGRKMNNVMAETATPDFALLPDANGELQISGRDRWLPRLKISPEYLQMLDDPELDKETKNYLEEKVQQARELFEMLSFRSDTLYRVTVVLAEVQRDFLLRRGGVLHPLTMRQVADRLGIHETTVSRAVNGKYLRTVSGVVSYKKFFAGGYRDKSGEDVATDVVFEKLKEIIANEDPRHPLSDEAIAGKLQLAGYPVARRTVAKYRTKLGILSTSMRRKY